MNTRFSAICLVILLSLSTSSCGMKRALTLPKKETAKVEKAETKALYADLSKADSIDILKPKKVTR